MNALGFGMVIDSTLHRYTRPLWKFCFISSEVRPSVLKSSLRYSLTIFAMNSICSPVKSPMCSVNLPENVPCVDEENLVVMLRLRFSTIQKPERARKSDGVKKVELT